MIIKCPECNKDISDKASACPNCGCPVFEEELNDKPQQVEVTALNIKLRNPKRIKTILIATAVILILAIITFSFFTIKAMKEEKKARELYIINLKLVNTSMEFGAGQSESLCNLTYKVWYNTIHDELDGETDEYRIDGGVYTDDFNVALINLYGSETAKSYIEFIESSKRMVDVAMKELSNPPKEFEKSYKALEDLYPSYKGLTDLAINPTGSLQSFIESKNNKIDEFQNNYDKFNLQLPDVAKEDLGS